MHFDKLYIVNINLYYVFHINSKKDALMKPMFLRNLQLTNHNNL